MKKILILLAAPMLLFSCKEQKKETPTTPEATEATADDWTSLMDSSLWRAYNRDVLPGNWEVTDSLISCFGKDDSMGGDIITDATYDNFELELEWKLSAGGNSGILYHVVEDTIYHSPYETGPEYQILDDVGFPEPVEDWQLTGADYAMYTPNDQKELKPIGEWNSSKIISDHGKVSFFLNGKKIVEFDKKSDDWMSKRTSGKWKDYPDYAKSDDGHIALQDHGAGVWFRNVRIKRLP